MATHETTLQPRSRRALLAAGVGALGAAAAAAVARITPTAAADGDAVTVGGSFSGSQTTSFQTDSVAAISGTSDSAGGVSGTSTSGQGVHGQSTSSAGVRGISDQAAGVHGTSTSSRGLWGQSTSGPGVEASGAIGVKASGGTDGYAIQTESGRLSFAGISGITTIKAGDNEVHLKPSVPVTSSTFVLVTPEADPGEALFWFSKAPDNGEVTIHVKPAPKADTKVAYLILEHPSS